MVDIDDLNYFYSAVSKETVEETIDYAFKLLDKSYTLGQRIYVFYLLGKAYRDYKLEINDTSPYKTVTKTIKQISKLIDNEEIYISDTATGYLIAEIGMKLSSIQILV